MVEETSNEAHPEADSSSPGPILIGVIFVIVIVFWDLLTWMNGGGSLSIIAAARAVIGGQAIVDVDNNGLRFPIMLLICLAVLGLCQLARIDAGKGLAYVLVLFGTIGGGFIVDGVYGETLIARYMASHGYSRCEARDHEVGSGKGRVWFDDFVHAGTRCAKGAPVTPG